MSFCGVIPPIYQLKQRTRRTGAGKPQTLVRCFCADHLYSLTYINTESLGNIFYTFVVGLDFDSIIIPIFYFIIAYLSSFFK